MNYQERATPAIEGIRRWAEPPIQRWIERNGFIPIEDTEAAITARIDTLRSSWALKGLDYMLDLSDDAPSNTPSEFDPRVDRLAEGVLTNHWTEKPSPRLKATLDRLIAIPHRKEHLTKALSDIYGYGTPNENAVESRRRLGMMLDVVEGLVRPPQGTLKGVIFTQTAYLLGNSLEGGKKETDFPFGFDEWAKFAVELGSGALPYLGSAVVYSELMGTGRFGDIEIVDFRDQEAIQRITSQSTIDIAFVSGATTFDRFVIDDLNRRLSQSNLTVINGGVAPTIDEEPGRYMANGASVFVGEFEGAASALLEEIERNPTPRVFLRDGSRSQIRRVKDSGAPFSTLPDLPDKVDMEEAYSQETERSGNLARRLEALEMMRIFPSFGGQMYDPAPFFRFHETVTSYGCPEACSFCATVPFQGRAMRQRPPGSIDDEWAAIDSPVVAIVDQNFHTNGREYVEEILTIAKRRKKKLAFEGELLFFSEGENAQRRFFDGSQADGARERLLQETVTAIQVGLEQPAQVRGTIPGGKDPKEFSTAMKRLNKLGIIVFGTGIIGMPKELWAPGADTDLPIIPYDSMSEAQWQEMVDTWVHWFTEEIPTPGAIPFAFTVVPGTSAHRILRDKGMLRYNSPEALTRRKELDIDLSPSIDPNVIKGVNSRKAVEDVRRKLYSWSSTQRRVGAANLSLKRTLFMYGVNYFAGRSLRDTME